MNFSNYQNLRSLFTAIGNKLTHRPETIEISQSEYNQLTQEQKADKSKVYYIYDADSDVTSLAELSDTSISNLSNGQLLSYDSTASKWKNVNPPADAVSDVQVNGLSVVNQQGVAQITVSVPNIEALNNVDVSNLGNGQILKYNSTSQEWQNEDDGFVILSYGNSTWNDFIMAYQANNIVYCRASSNSDPSSGSQTRLAFIAYVNDDTNPTEVEFQYYRSVSSKSANVQGDQVFIYKLNNADSGTWTVTTRSAYTKIVAGTNMTSSYGSGALTLNANVLNAPMTRQAFEDAVSLDDGIYPIEGDNDNAVLSSDMISHGNGTVEQAIDEKVSKSGDTMTGALNIVVPNSYGLLVLGNNKAQGAAGKSNGFIRMWANTEYRTDIYPASLTTNRSVILPDKTGTVALTSDIANMVSSTTVHNIVVTSSLPSDAGSHTDTLYLIASS